MDEQTTGSPPSGQGARRRGEQGLATLEWLLILAAVAGLAALAVTLVYYYVEDTGDRFAAPSPRRTAAQIQAAEVVNAAKSASAADFATWSEWERYFGAKCGRIAITISDQRIKFAANQFDGPPGDTVFGPGAAQAADGQAPTSGKARAACTVR